MNPQNDPLWRRFFSDLGIRLLCWSEHISWNWLRWKVDAVGSRIFSWAYSGSMDERISALHGEVPWRYLDGDLRDSIRDEIDSDIALEMLDRAVDSAMDEVIDILDMDHPGFDALDDPARELVIRSCEAAVAAIATARRVINHRIERPVPLLLMDKQEAAA